MKRRFYSKAATTGGVPKRNTWRGITLLSIPNKVMTGYFT